MPTSASQGIRPSKIMASISSFIEDELSIIQDQIGETTETKTPIKAINAAEKEAWLTAKALLLE